MQVRPLREEFLRHYLDQEFETVRRSVGGYHVEGRGAQLFERIEGSHFAVQGVPLLALLEYLRQRGLLLT
jgi:septum formation protein